MPTWFITSDKQLNYRDDQSAVGSRQLTLSYSQSTVQKSFTIFPMLYVIFVAKIVITHIYIETN